MRDVEGNELKEVEWIPDEHGKHQMLYPPEEKIPEVSGVDSYVKDESEVSDSKGCLISRRGSTFEDTVDNLPVHIYYDRPSTKSVFYNECAKVAIWRKVKLLVEDTDEMFFEWFIRNGFVAHLRKAPTIYNTVYTKSTNIYGYNISGGHKKDKMIDLIADDIKLNVHKNYFQDLLKEFLIFGKKNTDRVSAWGLTLIHDKDRKSVV